MPGANDPKVKELSKTVSFAKKLQQSTRKAMAFMAVPKYMGNCVAEANNTARTG
jgi:hypothetical protein